MKREWSVPSRRSRKCLKLFFKNQGTPMPHVPLEQRRLWRARKSSPILSVAEMISIPSWHSSPCS